MMKIPKSIRDIYSDLYERYIKLKENVDNLIQSIKDTRWHYESRIKNIESFAQKIETGRYSNPKIIEDFFGCTLVVENLASMNKAEKLVNKRFKFHERRPKKKQFTSKPSDSFRFDDTRIYVKWKDDPLIPPIGISDLLFEVQIKTFLAHAWGIATHDLIYKTEEKSWSKERIAYQIKAMLEHAEVSIFEAKKLASSTSLKKVDEFSKRISEIIELVNDLWLPISLPKDRKRLAENIDTLLRSIGINIQDLKRIIENETEQGRGTKTLNLSPYSTIVQSLINQEFNKMYAYMTGPDHRFKVFIAKEIELPESLEIEHLTNAVVAP